MKENQPLVATFSIIGYDPVTKETGIAVQSKFLSVGAVVPWAEAGAGAVATQSFANTSFGPRGLDYLKEGKSPEEVIELLVENDEDKGLRQFAVMDADGKTARLQGKPAMTGQVTFKVHIVPRRGIFSLARKPSSLWYPHLRRQKEL